MDTADDWLHAYNDLDQEYAELMLRFWDERTNRTIAEAEAVIESNVNRELQLLGNDLE